MTVTTQGNTLPLYKLTFLLLLIMYTFSMQKMNKNMYQQLSASVLLSRVKYLWFLYPLSFIQTEKGKMTIIVDFLSYIQKTLPKTQILNTMRWKHHTKRSITIIIGVFTCENMILVKGNLNTLHKNSIYVKDILDAPFMLTLKHPPSYLIVSFFDCIYMIHYSFSLLASRLLYT